MSAKSRVKEAESAWTASTGKTAGVSSAAGAAALNRFLFISLTSGTPSNLRRYPAQFSQEFGSGRSTQSGYCSCGRCPLLDDKGVDAACLRKTSQGAAFSASFLSANTGGSIVCLYRDLDIKLIARTRMTKVAEKTS